MNNPEELLARIINHLAEKFKGQLILKGGMLLRLLNSPRSTQDVDYVWVSKESKKVLSKSLEKALKEISGVKILDTRLNSRGIFIDLQEEGGNTKILVEVNVASSTHLPPEPLSTAPLANRYSLAGRVVSTMAFSEAFSHKIAATLERNVARDLYDLSLMESMGPLDQKTLLERLSKLSINRTKPISVNISQAAGILQKKLGELTEERMIIELYPLIPQDQRTGLLRIIRASVSRLIQRMETLSHH